MLKALDVFENRLLGLSLTECGYYIQDVVTVNITRPATTVSVACRDITGRRPTVHRTTVSHVRARPAATVSNCLTVESFALIVLLDTRVPYSFTSQILYFNHSSTVGQWLKCHRTQLQSLTKSVPHLTFPKDAGERWGEREPPHVSQLCSTLVDGQKADSHFTTQNWSEVKKIWSWMLVYLT